ncbi:hypothetical protein ACF3DV_13205 [Chlorogloeopsis fritschii PCC 9212]|uniref:MotA/TolQ/ExbB proton channel domain-containing protein n=1 Tax=Chlorogloeopsis fritschii PCC 6912 TaxID=211165 RepID=A0A433NRV0_CHLFR|nr:hypothetical protein [Chlorogloeopsis fritschii]RUR86879.1 hypothetical protein PCC6912_03220 [Chlorogloeopsis fritschii PCC 6912]
MDILEIWDIIWDDTPFHYATAVVLILAICVELYSVFRYCLKFRTTQTAINILNKWLKGKNSNPPSDKLLRWLNEHIGTDQQNRIEQRKRNNKYLLIKYPAILSRPVPRSSLRFVTTLCTAIGVLGTFYGIQQGLQDVNLDTRSMEQLMPAIKQLIAGMQTAFSTSLMGLGSGSAFTLVLFISDFIRQNQRDSLREKLDNITIQETAVNQESNSFQQVANNLNSLAKNLSGLQQLSPELIGEAVGKKILPGLEAIFKEQQRLRKLQENQGQRVLENLIQDLRTQVLEPIADRLDRSAELTQQASEAVLTLHRDLGTSITTIQSFQEQTLTQLQEFANDLSLTLSQFQTDTRGVLEQTAVEINRAVNQSIQGMTAQRTAFQESAENAAATFRGIREELEQALQQRAVVEQQMLQATRTGMINILSEAHRTFREQNSVLETTGNQASSLMTSARDNLLDALGNIDHTLTACRQTVQEDLTSFRKEYQVNLQNFFAHQNNLLEETLGQQRDGLSGVVNHLDSVFQEEYQRRRELSNQANEDMNLIRRTTREVGEFANAIGLNSSQRLIQLQEIAREIATQVRDIQSEYRALSHTFKNSLNDWKEHFEKTHTHFFSEADTAITQVCQNLYHSADVLVKATDNRNHFNGNH